MDFNRPSNKAPKEDKTCQKIEFSLFEEKRLDSELWRVVTYTSTASMIKPRAMILQEAMHKDLSSRILSSMQVRPLQTLKLRVQDKALRIHGASAH
eukprot:6018771-Amphidinium_carterae.2